MKHTDWRTPKHWRQTSATTTITPIDRVDARRALDPLAWYGRQDLNKHWNLTIARLGYRVLIWQSFAAGSIIAACQRYGQPGTCQYFVIGRDVTQD